MSVRKSKIITLKIGKKLNTLILGIGNTILSDDGVGIKVAEEIKKTVDNVDIKSLSISGLAILSEIDGYEKVIIIDSMKTGKSPPGSVIKLSLDDLSYAVNLSCYHNVNLPTALEIGKRYCKGTPKDIEIYAIEVKDNVTFSERCTPEIERAIPEIAKKILREQFNA